MLSADKLLIFAGGVAAVGVARHDVMAVVIVAHAMTGLLIAGVGMWSFGAMGIRVGESFRKVARGETAAEPSDSGRSERE